MALIRTYKQGDGTPVETALYTNATPTTQYSGGTINLSQGISNFDAIKIVCRISTSVATEVAAIVDASEYANYTMAENHGGFGIIGRSSTTDAIRTFNYSSDTAITAGPGQIIGAGGAQNGNLIPVSVIGIKY